MRGNLPSELEIKHENIFHHTKEILKILKKTVSQLLLMSYLHHKNSKEITLVYKSEHSFKRENNVLLLMINGDKKYYYFAVKNKLELYSSECLRSKKESITNGDNCFQNALNDALNYQTIETHPERISKLKPYINKYNWKDIKFLSDKDDWKKFEQNNKDIALNILFVPHNKKEIGPAYIYQNIATSVKIKLFC